MKKIGFYIFDYFACGLLWVILNEKASLSTLAIGMGIGVVAIYISEKHLSMMNYRNIYYIDLWMFSKYAVFLLGQIFISGVNAAKIIITGTLELGVVEIETAIKDPFKKSILANSITLTPGTVTIDVDDEKLTVLWIKCITKECGLAGDYIKGDMERKLLGG